MSKCFHELQSLAPSGQSSHDCFVNPAKALPGRYGLHQDNLVHSCYINLQKPMWKKWSCCSLMWRWDFCMGTWRRRFYLVTQCLWGTNKACRFICWFIHNTKLQAEDDIHWANPSSLLVVLGCFFLLCNKLVCCSSSSSSGRIFSTSGSSSILYKLLAFLCLCWRTFIDYVLWQPQLWQIYISWICWSSWNCGKRKISSIQIPHTILHWSKCHTTYTQHCLHTIQKHFDCVHYYYTQD